MNENKRIYTVGHSTVSDTVFLKLLQKFGVTCIVDVRSVPFSRYAPQFNKDELRRFLRQNNIQYVFMGEEFGARRYDRELYSDRGYLDFERTRKSKAFLRGIERIRKGVESGFTIALMCTEKQAIDCHRSIMVSKGLIDAGFQVLHIGHNQEITTQQIIEKELIKNYFPETNMFAEQLGEPLSEDQMIAEAYRRKNQEIGFKGNEDTEAARM